MNLKPGCQLRQREEFISTGATLSCVFWQCGPCSVILCVCDIFASTEAVFKSFWVLLQILFVWASTKAFISLLKSKKSTQA